MVKKSVAFSKNASNLFFHILTKCNLSCRHCYINKTQHGDTLLDIGTINQWLHLFSGKGKEMNVIFLGGEPTLHPELAAACRTAREIGFTSITIDTNGYLFHDILNRVTSREVDFISFSLDGATRETNDRIRGKGCYDTCLGGINRAVSKGFSVSVIYTVSSDNFQELSMMPGLVRELGIDRLFIQVIGIRGKSTGENGVHQVSKDHWLGIIPEVAREIAGHGITVTYPKVFLGPGETFQCAALVADNYFIFPNGRVYRCPLCEDYPVHSLEIRDNRLINTESINENDLFRLTIPEGCVMNKLVQPGNLVYKEDGTPVHQIACCLLKEEINPGQRPTG